MKLIHVTKIENFESILITGFRFSQCREVFTWSDIENSVDVRADFFLPMISFFGMTLDEHLRTAQTYGNLGIVFKDEIMNLCELNPVRYVSKHSIIAKRISQFEDYKSSFEFSDGEIIVHGKGGISDVQFNSFLRGEGVGFKYHAVRTWLENLAYSKSFIAELERRDKESQKYYISNENYIFGMEREWRLVPTKLFVNFDKTKNRLEDDEFF